MDLQKYTYLIIDIGCLIVPLFASFYPKHAFYKEWKYFLPANIGVAALFLVWDAFFTQIGVWGFNPDYLSGIYIYNLPLEEVLFFICIPYACVFTWFAFSYLLKKDYFEPINRQALLVLGIILLAFGLIFIEKWYTASTFLLTGTYLVGLWFNKSSVHYVFLSYLAILPFFFMSNGILTGSILDQPIVWYNNTHNLGIRIGTIPLEDSIYGFLLILLNIQLYKFIKREAKWKQKIKALLQ